MPLFEYKCTDCGYKFEELRSNKEDTSQMQCRKCGGSAHKIMSTFSSVTSGGSTNETVDMKIGREANKRWQAIYDRQSKRRKSENLKTFSLPRNKDGKFMPVMGLGDKQEKSRRNEYVGALQEHRRKREAKGQPQFDGPGSF